MKPRRGARRAAAVLLALAALSALVLLVLVLRTPLPPELSGERAFAPSVRVLDRRGKLLREARASDGARARFVPLEALGAVVPAAMLAAEDKRFFVHPGIDVWAIVRAIGQAVRAGRIVSGASTLTQQLARSYMTRPRTLAGKLAEVVLALRIEASLSKREILEAYLNRAPFGPGLRGIEAASRHYFDKAARDLSLAEAAMLAGIPRGPTLYDPSRGSLRAERRRNRVLARMLDNGFADRAAIERASREPVVLTARRSSAGAPHFVRALLAGALPGERPPAQAVDEIVTTIDSALQREAEVAVAATVRALTSRDASAAAVIVLENATGDVLAYVGSPDINDRESLGENDGVLAERQPGSTLKPFVYELAFEQLGFTAATTVADVDLHVQHDSVDYHPQNYDQRHHGPVRVREALANSYNVPAVSTAALLGPRLLDRLREVGLTTLRRDATHYGPALALGDGEVRLIDLAAAYAALARGGTLVSPRVVRSFRQPGGGPIAAAEAPAARVMAADHVAVIDHILRDQHARAASFGEVGPLDLPFDVAVKTGTSKGFRDNWTVGYTARTTVAVWVGNFDGRPMRGVSGVAGAGPLFRAVMTAAEHLYPSPVAADAPDLAAADVCALSGALAADACPHRVRELFAPGTLPRVACRVHVERRIDLRNGLLASDSCPPSHVAERTFEQHEPIYAAWALAAARPVAPASFSPLCGPPPSSLVDRTSTSRAQITFPFDGASFAYDEEAASPQTLTIRAIAPPGAKELRFHLDGRLALVRRAPFTWQWGLARGPHELYAEAEGGVPGAKVRFTVQ